MTPAQSNMRRVRATVEQVLALTGLAYVSDATRSWAITKSTPGAGLGTLRPGQALDITLVQLEDAEIVSGYAALGD